MITSEYRGKRIDNGEWIYGALIVFRGEYYIANPICVRTEDGERWLTIPTSKTKVDPSTVGQFTGLCDKNGKKIFEGDIVGFEDGMSTESGYAESGCTGCVFWDKETASFQVDNRLSAESYEVLEECAIIGNIYDNPELLQEG